MEVIIIIAGPVGLMFIGQAVAIVSRYCRFRDIHKAISWED
jgi:hypothetical protein